MKITAIALALISASALCVYAQDAAKTQQPPVTLEQAYKAALKQSETLAEQGANIDYYEQRINEMHAALLPQVNLTASQTWQDNSSNADDPTNTVPTSYRASAIAVHQPLFTGLRDIIALKGAKVQTAAQQAAYARAKQILYENVAQAYLNLLSAQDTIAIRQAQIDITAQLITELLSREKIGRSRHSEVLAAQSQLAQDQAALASSLGAERVAQWTFRFLTGMDGDAKPAALAPVGKVAIDDYLVKAHSRPDVEQAKRNLEYAELFMDSEKNQRLPSAAFDGHYYLDREAGTLRHVYWDTIFSVSIPLYLGGSIDAQTAEADAQRRSAVLALQLALRQADLDVHSAHDSLLSGIFSADAQQNALAAAQANAAAQKADYRYGLVTNLDVLTSLTTVETTKLSLEQAQIAVQLSKAQLDVAAGIPQ